MNSKDLSALVSKNIFSDKGFVVPRYKIEAIINSAFKIIKESTNTGENVTITNFGIFTTRQVPHKVVKSVFTKNSPDGQVEIPSHTTPLFKASSQYKSLLRYGSEVKEQ